MKSREKLRKAFKPDDLPLLIEMMHDSLKIEKLKDIQIGIKMAIAGFCEPAIEQLRSQQTPGYSTQAFDDSDVLSSIGSDGYCSPAARKAANELAKEIRDDQSSGAQKVQEQRGEEEKKDQELQTLSIKMMNKDEARKVPIEKRREVFERSIHELRLDRSKPADEKMYQNLYKSMVLLGE